MDLTIKNMAIYPDAGGKDGIRGKDKLLEEPGKTGQDEPLRTVDDLVRSKARLFPDRVILAYPSSGVRYVNYTMKQLDVFAYRVARHYASRLPVRSSSEEQPTVVALLGPSNFEYAITMLALMKLGHTILFLSTRISHEAIQSLMETTSAGMLLIDPRHAGVAGDVAKSLPAIGIHEIAPRQVFELPLSKDQDTRLDMSLDHDRETTNIVYIIHSSGSTGLPKPIYQTHKAALANYVLSMKMAAFITLPLYHNHGVCNFFRAVYAGTPIHMYNADLPLTSAHLTTILREHYFEIFYGVPYALKLLAESDGGIDLLRRLKIVMYGGSACPDELGDLLVDRGIYLVGHYGATEVGQLMTSFRPPGDKAWNYVREHERLIPFLTWIPRGPGLFECCVRDGWPSKVASNQPDGSYATKDLFEAHPTIPRAWKYIARLDDTVVLVNGEKFNPLRLEGKLRSDSHVSEAVVFGAGRSFPGVLVVPAESTSNLSRDAIVDNLWPVVRAANQSAEGYARISREMIRILPHDCQVPRTDKGSVIRQAFYKVFEQEIRDAYDATDTSISTQRTLSFSEVREFLRHTVRQVLGGRDIGKDDTDFFSLGMDSLQAIQIRGEILRNVDIGGNHLNTNVVFDHPSINELSAFLASLSKGDGNNGQEEISIGTEAQMKLLVDRYSSLQGQPVGSKTSVVVTGATGSLGAHIAARLCQDTTVSHVYCLVRAEDDKQASNRLRHSLLLRKVYHTLSLHARDKLHALPFNQTDNYLGLSHATYDDVARDLRAAIHCAWPVNFNLRLSSFEESILGVRNLLGLCLAAGSREPASFNFCSSVSTVARAPATRIPESAAEFSWAQGMGYAQAKSVAERICIGAAAESGIRTRVLRVGQIIADTEHGIWNATEAVPLMMQTALTVGALPRLAETPSWLPVDVVAQTAIDISLSDAAGGLVANVVNPQNFSWTADLLPALRVAGLEFEEVAPSEWIWRLRVSDPDPTVNPPIKLVDFFASKYDDDNGDGDKDERALPSLSKTYATANATSFSPTLTSTPALDPELVRKFIHRFVVGPWKPSLALSASSRPLAAAAATTDVDEAVKLAVILAGPPDGSRRGSRTTLGNDLARRLPGAAFIDGDALYARSAVEQIRSGILPSQLEWDAWLGRVSRRAEEAVRDLGYGTIIVSCPLLERTRRDRLRNMLRASSSVDGPVANKILVVDLQPRINVSQGGAVGEVRSRQTVEDDSVWPDEDDVIPVDAENPREELLEQVAWAVEWSSTQANS